MTGPVPSAAPARPPPPRVPPGLPRRWYLIVFGVALLMRAGFGAFRLIQAADAQALEFPDEHQYWQMAVSLHSGAGLRDELGFQATRMPLYPAFLSLFAGLRGGVIFGKLFQWLIGAVGATLAAGAATALVHRRVGVVAGLLVALDPFLVFFSSLLLTETLFVTLLVGLWWVLAPILKNRSGSPVRWLGVGFLAVSCVYLREAGLGLVLVALASVVMARRLDPPTVLRAAIAGSMVVVALLPWAARNRRVTGEWCWLTTRAGVSLYDGVGPQATGASSLDSVQRMPAVADLTETEWNRFFLSASLAAIKEDPARIVRLAGVKLLRMWNPFPNVATYQSRLIRTVSAVWTIPTFAFAVVGALGLPIIRKSDGLRITLFLLLPAIYLSALHSVFVGSVRYRMGALPMLEMLAAFVIVSMADRLRTNKAAGEPARAG